MTARSITRALRGRWLGGYGSAQCPAHDDHSPSLKIADDPRKADGVDVHCFAGCDWRDVKAALKRGGLIGGPDQGARLNSRIDPTKIDRRPATGQAARIDSALRLFGEAVPIAPGSPAWCYLTEHRRLEVVELGGLSHALRWHSGIGAIVALFRDVVTDNPCGVHRTFINSDGSKHARRMLGRAGGAAIKLDANADVVEGLHIGEGLETCIAAMLAGFRPVWALGSEGAISTFPTLPGVEALTILGEVNDGGANARSTLKCGHRWSADGCDVLIVEPIIGDDLAATWEAVAA